jgi:hypothetical protein
MKIQGLTTVNLTITTWISRELVVNSPPLRLGAKMRVNGFVLQDYSPKSYHGRRLHEHQLGFAQKRGHFYYSDASFVKKRVDNRVKWTILNKPPFV